MLAMRRSLATVAVAQHAGLFDMARGSPFTADRVASKLSITPRAAEAMVAVLASLGLAAVQGDGAFVLSEEAQTQNGKSGILHKCLFYIAHCKCG